MQLFGLWKQSLDTSGYNYIVRRAVKLQYMVIWVNFPARYWLVFSFSQDDIWETNLEVLAVQGLPSSEWTQRLEHGQWKWTVDPWRGQYKDGKPIWDTKDGKLSFTATPLQMHWYFSVLLSCYNLRFCFDLVIIFDIVIFDAILFVVVMNHLFCLSMVMDGKHLCYL